MKLMEKAGRRVIAFTGAGISTACGIPDFRGPTGKWTREAQGLTPLVGTSMSAAVPSFTHRALVALMAAGKLAAVVSQNTDGLHARSGIPLHALWELHGNCWKSVCWGCGHEELHDAPARRRRVADCAECKKRVPRICHCVVVECPRCGATMKDSIIHFGEDLSPPVLAGAVAAGKAAHVCLALGSSLTVTPAADIPASMPRHRGHLVIVNLQATPLDDVADVVAHGRIDAVMAGVCAGLGVVVPPAPAATPPAATAVAAAAAAAAGTTPAGGGATPAKAAAAAPAAAAAVGGGAGGAKPGKAPAAAPAAAAAASGGGKSAGGGAGRAASGAMERAAAAVASLTEEMKALAVKR